MGQRSTIEKLPEEEFDFVINCLLDNLNDREVSLLFEKRFKKKLPKSNINRWRENAGRELIDRYRLARFQAKQLRQDLSLEEGDDYQNVIKNIEERLLTATREVIHQNPAKLLLARQREENFRLKREQLELKREEIALEREKLRGVALDRVKLGGEFMQDFLEYLNGDAEGISFLTKHIKKFGEFLKQKYATTES